MRILKILTQHRRDFTATLVCEHCQHTQLLKGGYDDAYYHAEVLPNIPCGKCAKVASADYQPNATKYEEGYQI